MKLAIKKYLQKKGWYEYVRYSSLFSLYTFFLKRQVIQRHQIEVSFYKSFLPPCSLIFDIGAFDGHKTAAFLEISKKVVCCEPDGHNFRTLQIRFRNLRSRVIVKNLALSDCIGDAVYHIHHPGSAVNTLSPKWKQILEEDDMRRWDQDINFSEQTTVSCVTLDYLIQQHGTPQFIKIDVEGSEQFVLKGLSKKIPYISFECLLPDCKQELLQCMEYLYRLDNNVLFTVAYEEALELDQFINYEGAIKWVHSARSFCFEMIAKMST